MYGYHAGGGLELVDQILTWIGSIAEERDIFRGNRMWKWHCTVVEDRLRREALDVF